METDLSNLSSCKNNVSVLSVSYVPVRYWIKFGLWCVKSKITKILNHMENSERIVPNQMAKSKAQTNQTNG